MTVAKPKISFEDYLVYDDGTDNRYEWTAGELKELPPESEPNNSIANYLFLVLASSGIPFRLIHPHTCEVEVPLVQFKDPRTRYPDLVVLQEEHLALTQRRLTITQDMRPPQLVVEVVSPGKESRERDYDRKLAQYQARGIPEYWIVDRGEGLVLVMGLEDGVYTVLGQFRGENAIASPTFPQLQLTPQQIFEAV